MLSGMLSRKVVLHRRPDNVDYIGDIKNWSCLALMLMVSVGVVHVY